MKPAIIALLLAFLAAAFAAAPAAAHAVHASGARATAAKGNASAVTLRSLPRAPHGTAAMLVQRDAGEFSIVAAAEPGDNGCSNQADECCSPHCCIGLALTAAAPEVVLTFAGTPSTRWSAQSPPDTAPSTPLRPPSR